MSSATRPDLSPRRIHGAAFDMPPNFGAYLRARGIPDERNCVGRDPEMFFCEADQKDVIREVRRICGACPVQEHCLNWAQETRTDYGWFGGRSARQRQLARAKADPNHQPRRRRAAA